MLNWGEVREMAEHRVSFASHGHTHRILTHVSKQDVHIELCDSAAVLREHDLPDLPLFCYPNGAYAATTIEALGKAGYLYAVTTRFGAMPNTPVRPFGLNRICIHSDVGPTVERFAIHLSGMLRQHIRLAP